ncbi:copper chaperone PCu(A)C [Siculibacillus lacustris]|uniref:Copper chaperone PCu(A)C n=1 Tax=Siculibacillus lacustris TaxID=1549641 RepID=A0A4V2KTI7_9HYPH|nr:copper chaperone PCu(A)C [Siculibacillus lacustris]TBW37411.1 copper chaperone PCu(A)C [Siculibacillus lacustris]
MKILLPFALAAGLIAAALPAQAHGYKVGALEIGHPWSRATPKAAPAGGGFLTVTNTGTTADRLVSVTSAVADKVEIHESAVVDGVMRMRPLERGLEIPAGAKVELKPGGNHVMFVGLKAPFEKGTAFKGTLTFEKAGSVEVDFAVEEMGAAPAHHGSTN